MKEHPMPMIQSFQPFLSLCLILLWADISKAQDKISLEPIDASGITGAILVSGPKAKDEALKRFVELAGADKAKIVLIPAVSQKEMKEFVDAHLKALKELNSSVEVVAADNRDAANDPKIAERFKNVTGVWIAGDELSNFARTYRDTVVSREIQNVLHRGGVVAAQGTVAEILGRTAIGLEGQGFDLLPDTMVDPSFSKPGAKDQLFAGLKRHPGLVGIGVRDEACLILKGREARAIGVGGVAFCIPASPSHQLATFEVTAKGVGDLTQYRRIARSRFQTPAYPPKELPVPEVPKGSLVIVGGGGMPAEITKKFIELAGGPESLIVVLPTAMPDPLPPNADGGFLLKAGCKNVKVIQARARKDVEIPENLKLLKEAKAIWFGGGRQWRFVDAYEGTKAHQLFQEVLKRGGVIGGSSAGATIQGDFLCRGAPAGPQFMMCEGYERALGFLPGVAIDQHFTQRKRQPDMTALMKVYPQFLGIGLDEATAIVVQGHEALVMGRGQAHFYDRKKPVKEGEPDFEAIKAGGRYDLKERRILENRP